ncbi:MAG: DUF695 domain-containing protein [Terracidiphilus sp.]
MAGDSDVKTWATAISTDSQTDRQIIFRYAETFSHTFIRATQPIRIIIVWKYQSERGQPMVEELQLMYLLEDALESVLDQNQFATLALVSTGEDLREWTYYAKSEDEFMARLNFAFIGMSAFPIEIHIAHDPQWETYEQFRAGIRETVN